jgi:AraC-like DNA-binding protein
MSTDWGFAEACERMLNPKQSLADVSYSYDLGFADQSHFTRTFQGITGESPGAFPRMLSKSAITSVASLSRLPF